MLGTVTPECIDDNLAARMIDDGLDGAELERVTAHIDGCDDCRRLVSELARNASRNDPSAAGPTLMGLWNPSLNEVGLLLQPGVQVGRYVVEAPLGTGGMGVVWSARDPDLGRQVALKLLRTRGDSDEDDTARLRMVREAQSLARLAHPNVVTIYDVGTWQGRVFLAMELVTGGTFRQWMRARDRRPREIVATLLAAADGLSAAHEKGLVHRDFKPDNVMVGSDGRVRVTDFGLARMQGEREPRPPGTSAPPASLRTETGAVMGTPLYMAPEQGAGEPTDEKTDQYSFCVTLYEALTGELPSVETPPSFDGGAPATERSARLPVALARALRRGLARDPLRRHPSMAALTHELRRALGATRRRVVAGTATVALLALAAVGLLGAFRYRAASWHPVVRALLPAYDESSSGADFSTDGQLIAYDSDRDGSWRVYVGPLDGAARAITPIGVRAMKPRFTADGRSLLVQVDDTVWRSSLDGSSFTELARDAALADDCAGRTVLGRFRNRDCASCGDLRVREPDGGEHRIFLGQPDEELESLACDRTGRRVVFGLGRRHDTLHTPTRLFIMGLDDQKPRLLVEPEGGGDPQPSFGPDGRSVVYTRWQAGGANLWELPLGSGTAAGTPRQLSFGGSDVAPRVAPNGKALLFQTQVTSSRLFVLDLHGGAPRRLRSELDDVTFIDLTAHQKALALEVRSAAGERVLLFDPETGAEEPIAEGIRPTFTRDGHDLLWATSGDPARVLTRAVTGGPSRTLATLPGRVAYMLCTDDRMVYAGVVTEHKVRTMRFSLAGGPVEDLGDNNLVPLEGRPGWSLQSNLGSAEVVPPGARVDDPENPRIDHCKALDWNSDAIFCQRGSETWRQPVQGGPAQKIATLGPLFDAPGVIRVSADGNTLYFMHDVGKVRRQLMTNFGERPR